MPWCISGSFGTNFSIQAVSFSRSFEKNIGQCSEYSPCQDVNVRKAISYAIDRETMVEALYMATVGGGDFWADFGEKVGLFEDGYAFDALVLDDDPLKNMRAFSAAERLERYAYLGKGKLTAKFAAGEKLL